MTRRAWWLILVPVTLVVLVPVAVMLIVYLVPFEPKKNPEFFVINRMSSPLTITVTDTASGPPDRPSTVAAHGQLMLNVYPCRGTGATATAADGRTIATLGQPLCAHGIWVIEADGTSHLEDSRKTNVTP